MGRVPISVGERVVVAGNMQPYAAAYVVSCTYIKDNDNWEIKLRWPNAPGGEGHSRVWSSDERNVWFRYVALN